MTAADGRPRDAQRARLYRAEGEVGTGRRLPTVERMQGYVDELASADWFVARWGDRAFDVRPGFGHRRATADQHGVLQMPKWARSELVLLHEVAHCLTPRSCAAHGPEYAGVLLAVVRRAMSPAAAQALEDAFIRHRVRWTAAALPAVQAPGPAIAAARSADDREGPGALTRKRPVVLHEATSTVTLVLVLPTMVTGSRAGRGRLHGGGPREAPVKGPGLGRTVRLVAVAVPLALPASAPAG